MNNVRKRNWVFLAYPESIIYDWIHRLERTGLQCAVTSVDSAYRTSESISIRKAIAQLVMFSIDKNI